jgi:hypothetical protein
VQFDATQLSNVEQTGVTKKITSTATTQDQTMHEAMEMTRLLKKNEVIIGS